jgi:hypothetical protein
MHAYFSPTRGDAVQNNNDKSLYIHNPCTHNATWRGSFTSHCYSGESFHCIVSSFSFHTTHVILLMGLVLILSATFLPHPFFIVSKYMLKLETTCSGLAGRVKESLACLCW